MKPDNKKRRKTPRGQDGYFGSWEPKRVFKAKKLKREFKKIRAWIDRYLKDHPGDERRANRQRRTHMTEAERKTTSGKTAGAPPGKRWVSDTCKHHALTSPNGKVLASVVTDGDASDAVMFAELCSRIPKGSGNAMGDRAYCSEENFALAVGVGRDPYFEPKKSYQGNGMSAWAEMVRLWKEHP